MEWEAIKDLCDRALVLQKKFPISKLTLSLPIEMMNRTNEYAKQIGLKVKFKDLDDEIKEY